VIRVFILSPVVDVVVAVEEAVVVEGPEMEI
jgi:hypothetical protein